MNDYSQNVIKKIREYKCLDDYGILKCVCVRNQEGKVVAYLRPITENVDADMPEWITLLTKWRIENPSLSDNEFVPTEERTKRWLKNSIINSDDKILFMILDVTGRALGHIGLCDFDYEHRRGVVYSVLRGVSGVSAGLMEMSLRCLIEWSSNELGIESFELTTQKTNVKAIRLYEKVGFEITETIPLKKIVLEDEIRWVPDIDNGAKTEKYRVRMEYRG